MAVGTVIGAASTKKFTDDDDAEMMSSTLNPIINNKSTTTVPKMALMWEPTRMGHSSTANNFDEDDDDADDDDINIAILFFLSRKRQRGRNGKTAVFSPLGAKRRKAKRPVEMPKEMMDGLVLDLAENPIPRRSRIYRSMVQLPCFC